MSDKSSKSRSVPVKPEEKLESEFVTVRHGRLRMDIPSDWADRSSLVFISPPQSEPSIGLSGKKASEYHNNINVNFEPQPEDVDSTQEYLKSVSESLREAGMDFQDFGLTSITMGGYEGSCIERRVMLGDVWVRQLTAVAFMGDFMIVATTSTSEAVHKQELPKLRKLLESVYFEGGAEEVEEKVEKD